ncbi:permease [Aquisalimonas lutea]|uniref:permease n=1 Tax=Aquisalimonas lutea TaxID=1327750 RepID=UPI0025B307BD|nr:permease [Aquisalimonas lutea]MDN3519543.1 permease [Aquisalimonas lutea]
MQSDSTTAARNAAPWRNGELITWLVTAGLVLLVSVTPRLDTSVPAALAAEGAALLPIIAIAAALAGALAATDLSNRILAALGPHPLRGIVIGSAAGAVTPVCGIAMIPLIAVLLRRGLPLPAVMAFWVSSPVTDPAMLAMTAGVLGMPFAVAKTASAFGIGLFAGAATRALPVGASGDRLLRAGVADGADCRASGRSGWVIFAREALGNARLIARWLALALVLEVLLQRYIPPEVIEATLGNGGDWLAVPLAAVVGAPVYLDGYAALPLARGLAELGMTTGAVMALLVAGAAVSLYAAVAVFSVVHLRVFALYIGLAVVGAIVAGYTVDAVGVPIPGQGGTG